MSQDAEDGPEIWINDQRLLQQPTTRAPMDQEEFDAKFLYHRPDHKHSVLVRHTAKFLRRYYRPCTSPKAFISTILSFVPIISWLPKYNFSENLLNDAIGGLTVGVMHVPQGIAYAMLAGVHPVVGLYTSFFPPLFYMMFGTSRHNSIGSFAVVSLMAGVTVNNIHAEYDAQSTVINTNLTDNIQTTATIEAPSPIMIASTLALCVGLIQILMGFLRLEIITTYFSDQVVAGFTTGASMHVFTTQLKDFFGIPHLPKRYGPGNMFLKLYDILSHATDSNIWTVIISVGSLLFLVIGKDYANPWVKRKFNLATQIPFELILVILTTFLSFLFHFHSKLDVKIVSKLPIGMPSPQIPDWSLIPKVLPNAIGIAVVVLAIHISLGKMFAKKLNYKIDPGQELYALGLSSSLSAVFPVYPVSCSLGRTLVNVEAAAIILYVGQWLRTLPMCVLSAIIMFALKGMFKKILDLRTLWPLSKIDFSIWLVSFLATICWDVSEGLAVSIIYALMTTVCRTQWPRWHFLSNLNGTNDFRDAERYQHVEPSKGICIFRFDSPLLFTNVDLFKTCIEKAATRWQNQCPYELDAKDLKVINPKISLVDIKDKHIDIDQICEIPILIRNGSSSCSLKNVSALQQHFIIDCSGFTFVDYMGVNALKEVFTEMRNKHVIVYFAAAKAPVRDLFEASGFYKSVPKCNFYPTIRDAVAIAKKRQYASAAYLLTEISMPHDALEAMIKAHPMD
uniref:STAS domain-containing protein n=1 Tax=Acrobeloides nanus TaxID=290746 RepID=A0A914CB78_9BILA